MKLKKLRLTKETLLPLADSSAQTIAGGLLTRTTCSGETMRTDCGHTCLVCQTYNQSICRPSVGIVATCLC